MHFRLSNFCDTVWLFSRSAIILTTALIVSLTMPSENNAQEDEKNIFLQVILSTLQSNPQIQEARSRLIAAQEKYNQNLAIFLPHVNMVSAINNDRIGREHGASSNTQKSLGVEISQTIVDIPAILSFSQTKPYIAAFEEDLQATSQIIILETVRAMINVRQAEEIAKLAEQNLATANRNLKMTEAGYQAGDMTKTDINHAQAQVANATAELARTFNDIDITRSQYKEWVGSDILPNLTIPEVPTTYRPPPLQDLLSRVDNRPDLRAANYRLEVSDSLVNIEKSGHMPSLNLSFTGNRYADTNLSGQELLYEKSIMLKASLPIFSGGSTSSRTREAIAARSTQKTEVARLRLQAIREIEQSYMTFESTRSTLIALQESVRVSRETLKGVSAEFRSGSRSAFDLMNTQNQLFQAETELTKGRYMVVKALFQLLFSEGELKMENLDKNSSPNRHAAPQNTQLNPNSAPSTPSE
ncbi:MAG: TolC family outer membrane protein [Magnetococcus sp. DMHC-6]